jgi:hypothetical protein
VRTSCSSTGIQAVAGIHQQQHHVRLVDGQQGLLGHGGIDAHLVAGDAAGIDDDEGRSPMRPRRTAVAGQTGKVGHQGIPLNA